MANLNSEVLPISRKSSPFDIRVHEIDLFRGLLIIMVLFDHLMNQFLINNHFWTEMAAVAHWYWNFDLRGIVRFFVLIVFCFISGISSAFSRNNWLRAGQLIGVWAILAVGSELLQTWGVFGKLSVAIPFNIIGVLGWSVLAYCFVQKKSWRSILAFAIAMFLFSWFTIPWLQRIIALKNLAPYAPALFKPAGPIADWMPLFPFAMFFMFGALLSYFLYRQNKESFTSVKYGWERPFCFIGRHTMLIYLSHIVILLLVFFLLNTAFGV